MKKFTIILLAAMLTSFAASAQIKFGVKAGATFNNFNTKNLESNFDNATGWQVGLMSRIKIPIVGIGIQPELLYTMKNAKVGESTEKLSYLQVPINGIWTFQLGGIGPFITAGPYFNYAISLDSAIENVVERFDWGLALGGGVGIKKFELGCRYEWGMQNIATNSGQSIKNNSFNLYLGYFF